MTESEKVISDVISAFDDWENNKCCPGEDWSDVHQSRDMVIALLKAQEAKLVHATANINHRKIGECPTCGKSINSGDYPNYCGRCGQAVKWEDAMNLRMIVSGHRQTIIAAVANGGTANDRL